VTDSALLTNSVDEFAVEREGPVDTAQYARFGQLIGGVTTLPAVC
jgi:hypothetical protein